jgi:catecholate siderophore receptor
MNATVREPLGPIPGFLSPTAYPKGSIAVWIPSLNGSVVYKPTPVSSVYFTYNYSQNSSGAVGNGGGITGWTQRANGTYFLDKENFTQPSELYEIGTKYSLMNNKVFLNFAIYDQKRTAKSTSSTTIQQYKYKGFEAELNYQPNKHLYGTLSYSFIDAKSTAPYQSDGGVAQFGAAIYSERQVSGLPKNLFNGLISYSFDNGFGVNANTVVTGKMNNNFAGSLTIPVQYTLDVGASYHWKKWDFRATVLNATDERNWSPPNAVYGNASILALPGTQLQVTAKYSF